MKKIMLMLVLMLALTITATPVLAVEHTIATGVQTVGITAFGDVDWDYFSTTNFKVAPYVIAIIVTGSINSRFVVRDASATGPILIDETLATAGTRVLYIGFKARPYVDFSDCTVVAGDKLTVALIR